MKTRWKYLIAGLAVIVLCMSVFTTTSDATVIWQDDFSDPNLPGWTLYGYENITSQVMIEGDFSAASGMLEVLDDDVNIARHDSTMAVGSWIFDMYVPDGYDGAFYVSFLSNGSVSWVSTTNHSHISAGFWRDAFIVWREKALYTGYIMATVNMTSIQGWHHIKVNRTSDGHFEVCINGTLRASFDYTGITSTAYLQVYSNNATGAALDNLVVSDDKTETTLTWELIMIGSGVAVAVIVLVIFILRRR